MTGNFTMERDWTTFSNNTELVRWLNFHLHHRDQIKSELLTTNGAKNELAVTTNGFVVDLTPPVLRYLRDGLLNKDRDFQV